MGMERALVFNLPQTRHCDCTIPCKKCCENIPAPATTMPDSWIAAQCPLHSTQPIPVQNAGSFNFTFDLGAGFQLYQSKSRSIRAEYRYHHISNHSTASANPGIDNGLLQVTYSFGR
jgi:opacity protein-like surface antigen